MSRTLHIKIDDDTEVRLERLRHETGHERASRCFVGIAEGELRLCLGDPRGLIFAWTVLRSDVARGIAQSLLDGASKIDVLNTAPAGSA